MTRKRRYLWFVGIYLLSLTFYAVATLLARTVIKFAF